MWTTIFAVFLVSAMIIGPIMMIQPSQRQRRLARLRTLAAKQGLRVHLGQNPAGGEPRQLALYSMAVDSAQVDRAPQPWCVGRQSLEHEINLIADWDWIGELRASKAVTARLIEWLPSLPAPIRAVEVTPHSVVLYWTEACWQREARWEDSASACLAFMESQLYWLYEQSVSTAQTAD